MIDKSDKKRLQEILKRFTDVRIAVVGDVMLDQFIWGTVDRISPEAPVPVVHVNEENYMLGGAANVANNLKALGGQVFLMGVVGDDPMQEQLKLCLEENGIDFTGLVSDAQRTTTVKTRIIAHSQQVVRFDREHVKPIERSSVKMILQSLEALVKSGPGLDGVIVSDYGKGVVGKSLIQGMRKVIPKKTIVAVDPKISRFSLYKGLSIITPNHYEAGAAVGIKLKTEDDVLNAGARLLKNLDLKAVLITRGEEGMSLFERGKKPAHIPTVAREVYDVTGAGDTVISTLSLALGSGASFAESAVLANHAAGIVVGDMGTSTVTPENLREQIKRKHVQIP